MDIVVRIFLSLFLGILIGLDRDDNWKGKEQNTFSKFSFIKSGMPAQGLGGVRTFSLISLLGFVSGLLTSLSPNYAFVGVLAFIGLIVFLGISYFLNYFDKNTFGLTTEMSILITFLLGFLLSTNLIEFKIILLVGIIVSLILSLKLELHNLIASFTKKEVVESLEFVLISFVILPWLPNYNITFGEFFRTIGLEAGILHSVTLLNPYTLWLVVVFVSTINFLGYFLNKVLKDSKSILISGFLGGIVSSTAVTEVLAIKSRELKTAQSINILLAATLIANSTSFIRIIILSFALNKELSFFIMPPLLLMSLATFLLTIIFTKSSSETLDLKLIFPSPLSLKPALEFAFIFLCVQVLTQIGLLLFGDTGFAVTTLMASLSGLDAITINISNAIGSEITLAFGAAVLFGAVILNLLLKNILVSFVAHKSFTNRLAALFFVIILTGIVGWFIF